MISGADPTALNKKQQTPYVVALSKDIRKAFQDFSVQYPDKFDYTKVGEFFVAIKIQAKINGSALIALWCCSPRSLHNGLKRRKRQELKRKLQ